MDVELQNTLLILQGTVFSLLNQVEMLTRTDPLPTFADTELSLSEMLAVSKKRAKKEALPFLPSLQDTELSLSETVLVDQRRKAAQRVANATS